MSTQSNFGGDLDYVWNPPLPSSPWNQTDGEPLCPSTAEYLYDPANCDPGYWCGCSSANPSLCIPSNDTKKTRWGGRFTTTNTTTGERIVLTGHFDGDTNECPTNYYCPGRRDLYRCPDLCVPGSYCPDPTQMLPCPAGEYCPIASSTPRSCESLEECSNTGTRRFEVRNAAIVMLCVILVSIIYLYAGNYFLLRSSRKAKELKLTEKIQKKEQNEEGADEESGTNSSHDSNLDLPEQSYVSGIEMMEEIDLDHPEPATKPSASMVVSSDGHGRTCRRHTLSSPEMTIDVEFDKLSLTIPNVGTIMRGVSGKIKHGSLTAIMGPSGAGKTTFLTIMSGKVDRTGGSLKVNGKESELTKFRKIIGFVPQEDVMLRELSVEEIVTHSALMRLPSSWSRMKKLARVDEVLESLEIDHIRDSIVGDEKRRGISGGQRKRVNIAMEMVTQPSLLCLDEPTSGLDSTTSYTVIRSLKDMANSGANVITVLHQPKYEVFELFDNVLLLGKGGMVVYYGRTVDMAAYFEKRGFPCPTKSNPADYYMDVLSGVVPHATEPSFDKDELFVEWMCAEENPDAISRVEAEAEFEKIQANSSEADSVQKLGGPLKRLATSLTNEMISLGTHLFRDLTLSKTSRQTPGTFEQAGLLFKRAVIQRWRVPSTSVMNIVLMIIAGAVLPNLVPSDANLYVGIPISEGGNNLNWEAYMSENVHPVDQVPGILTNIYFFMLIVSCLSVTVLGSERTVFFRETAVGQSVVSYWLAKTIEAIVWLPIYTSAFVLLGYSSDAWFLQPLRKYWLFLLMDLVGFYGFGMVSSLLVGPGSAALLSLVFGIIVTIGFSGTVNAYGDASEGMQSLINCWFLFWSTQGVVSEEYDQFRDRFDVDMLNAQTPGSEGNEFGNGISSVGAGIGMGFDLSSSFARNALFCALTACSWHLLVLWTLKTKDYRKHR